MGGGGFQSQSFKDMGAATATANWNTQAKDRDEGAARANAAYWARPENAAILIRDEETRRKSQEDALKTQAMDLNRAIARQRDLASKSQGRAGTITTSPLGVPGGGQIFGQKTLLGQ